MGDRGGGREPKGASLKKSKKNPGSKVAKAKTQPKNQDSHRTKVSSLPVPLSSNGPYFDCSCALLSRQFDRDRERVISRALNEGVSGMIIWFSDVEKQQAVIDACKPYRGKCYSIIGISPDNIDKTNKKLHTDWLAKVEELSQRPECVGILSGLNLCREMGTHFAQESVLRSCLSLATTAEIPLVLHIASDGNSLDRSLDIILEHKQSLSECSEADMGTGSGDNNNKIPAIVLHDAITVCAGDRTRMDRVVAAGLFCSVSGAGITEQDDANLRTNAQSCLGAVPLSSLMVCTDSPWKTPQNIADVYLRTLRNEPSNIADVVRGICEARASQQSSEDQESAETVAATLKENALRVFRIGVSETQCGTEDSRAEESEMKMTTDAEKKKPSSTLDRGQTALEKSQRIRGNDPASLDVAHYYSCAKCRQKLFDQTTVMSHRLTDAKSSVFRVGEEGLCSACVFVHPPSASSPQSETLSLQGETVQCSSCRRKLGRLCVQEGICACGVTVPGPILRLNAAKMDCTYSTLQTAALVEHAKVEAGQLEDEDLLAEGMIGKSAKQKRKKKAKLVSNNKGNFSSFRNKSFVPNASRVRKSAGAEQNHDNEDSDDNSEKDNNEYSENNSGTDDDEDDVQVLTLLRESRLSA